MAFVKKFPHFHSAEADPIHFCPKSAEASDLLGFSRQKRGCFNGINRFPQILKITLIFNPQKFWGNHNVQFFFSDKFQKIQNDNLQAPIIGLVLPHLAYCPFGLDFHLSTTSLFFRTKQHSTYLPHSRMYKQSVQMSIPAESNFL